LWSSAAVMLQTWQQGKLSHLARPNQHPSRDSSEPSPARPSSTSTTTTETGQLDLTTQYNYTARHLSLSLRPQLELLSPWRATSPFCTLPSTPSAVDALILTYTHRRLYRRALKLSLDWAVHRYLWRGQALYIRSLFEANRNVTEPRQRRVRPTLTPHISLGTRKKAQLTPDRPLYRRRKRSWRNGSTRIRIVHRRRLEVSLIGGRDGLGRDGCADSCRVEI
jgi:hypothetical protein